MRIDKTDIMLSECNSYLSARTGRYELRCERYFGAWIKLRDMGISNDDTLLDLGAGWTEFGAFMFSMGWRGRYWPVDGGLDGTDLRFWIPPRKVEFIVALELIEHFNEDEGHRFLSTMHSNATKGTVLTTPNADKINVLDMDCDHWSQWNSAKFISSGWNTEIKSFYGTDQDSVLAWKTPILEEKDNF